MTSRSFVIPLRDLEESPRTVNEALPDEWLRKNLTDTDVEPSGAGDGQLKVVLTKTGRDVLVQGKLSITIQVPCSRTLDPARYPIVADIFLMLSPRVLAKGDVPGPGKPGRSGKPRGKGKGRRTGSEEESERSLSDDDVACDHYDGEEVVLDDFLREFILLEIPMVPLREDLRNVPFEANPSPPEKRPLDPRLSPLAELKARLENKE